MATVNKKFSVKNGLAVDGNVAVSNIASFVVDGPSSDALTFTLSNVTSATVNGNEIITNTASQILSNKEFSGITQLNPSSGSQPNTGYGTFEYKDVDSGLEGLYITSNRGWISPQSGGNMYITSYDDIVLTSTTGNINFYMDGSAYIGDADSPNTIATYGWVNGQGFLTSYSETDPVFTASAAGGITSTQVTNWDTAYLWGDHSTEGYLISAVESISNGDDNIVFSSSTGTVTANLAANVTISNNLTVTGNLTVNGNVTTLNTETLAVEDNLVVLNTNVTGTPTLDAGIEVERGDYTNAKLYWNETTNAWHVTTPVDSSSAATDKALALSGNVNLDDAAIITANASATSGTPEVYTWAGATYSTAKFTIQMKQGSDIHVLEILAAIAGSSVYVTEYAEIISNTALGETDVTYDGTDAVLTVTPVSGTVVTKIVAQLIEV